jgi:hypothetical protein
MAPGVQRGGCILVLVVAMGGSSSNKNPPRMTSGGNGKPFFMGYAGSRQLGVLFKASQLMTCGASGLGGASVFFQPDID